MEDAENLNRSQLEKPQGTDICALQFTQRAVFGGQTEKLFRANLGVTSQLNKNHVNGWMNGCTYGASFHNGIGANCQLPQD